MQLPAQVLRLIREYLLPASGKPVCMCACVSVKPFSHQKQDKNLNWQQIYPGVSLINQTSWVRTEYSL